ncbi:MAG TPA: hypothetical protein VEH06_18415 [Candidatus Bathyarchaeia archaeon]|nr:hypothetical protein [Candidatus Bathyarchaeia archaeon]
MKVVRSELVSGFLLTTLFLITMLPHVFLHIVYGQDGTISTQSWINRENNIKILFSTTPAPPTKGTPSVLRFTVQNLETGDPVTNLLARVAIFGGPSNEETTFLLTNISAPDGRFSINVIFPNIGSYQIITRLMSQSHDVSSLASFTVTVPAMQSSNVFGGNYIIWISILIAIAVGVASFLVLKNTIKADKSQRM